MALQQAERQLSLKTPLGANELVVTALRGREEISRLFSFHLDLTSDNPKIAAPDIVGKNVTVTMKLADDSPRYFNGFVSRFFAGDEEQGRRGYRAEVVPWLWFLTRRSDCRIFQEMTVPQIVEAVFQELGFSDFDPSLSGNHPTRDYCVQYRETDFNFVSRLLEEEGIFYFFVHEDGKHVMKLADAKSAWYDLPENQVDYPKSEGSQAQKDHLTSWERRYEFRTGKVAHTDYNFETPSTSLMTSTNTVMKVPGVDKYEFYDYPGEYAVKGDGEALAKLRMEEEEAEYDVVEANSNCRTFSPAGRFKIGTHRSPSEEGKSFVVTAIEHFVSEQVYGSGSSPGADYRNRLRCIPDEASFRPARITPQPVVQGPQTAVVVGPGGEEIYTDEHGRVKVQFFWDRKGNKDQSSSCWIRVSSAWAGKGWGQIHIPRIGQEVIVDFLEGNPDCPIITGRVYNAEQMPPYGLPGDRTQSGIKSRSSLGGSAANCNEIRMEDKTGSEHLLIHAEKDHQKEVENDETHWVGHDRTKTIDNDETNHIKHDRTETVDNNETITIHANRTETVDKEEKITIHGGRTEQVDKDEKITIGGGRTENVAKDEKITIGGGRTENVSKDEKITIGGGRTENVSKDESITIGGGRTESVGKAETVKVGDNRSHTIGKNDTLNVGKVLTITAGDQITIKTGQASIMMKKDGTIVIQGKDITVNGKGKINQKAAKDMILKAKKILQN